MKKFIIVFQWIRRHIWCRLLLFLLLLPYFTYLSFSLWLNSNTGRAFLAQKMHAKSGLYYEIGSASWNPWTGVKLENVAVRYDAESNILTTIEQMRFDAEWLPLLDADVQMTALEINTVTIELTENDLIAILGEHFPKQNHAVAVKQAISQIDKSQSAVSHSKTKTEKISSPNQAAKSSKAKSLAGGRLARLKIGSIKNVNFIFKSNAGAPLIKLLNLNVNLPILGKTGSIEWSSLQLANKEIMSQTELELRHEKGGIVIEADKAECLEHEINFLAYLNSVFDYRFQGSVQHKKFEGDVGPIQLSHQGFQLKSQGEGKLFHPQTWRHQLQGQIKGGGVKHPSKQSEFDEILVKGVIQNNKFEVIEFGGTSNELNFRARGTVHFNGEIAGICRVTASSEEYKDLFRFTGGFQVHFPMKPIQNTDVYYNDVLVRGKLWNPEFKSSRKWNKLRDVVVKMNRFLEQEKQEELEKK